MTNAALAYGPACAAAAKLLLWLIGISYAIKFRRLLFVLASLAGATTSTIRGIEDAQRHVPDDLVLVAIYLGTPTVALIVAAFIVARYQPVWIGRGWRL